MKNECGQIHSPNYLTTCCIRHLLEMSKYAEMQTQTKKYSKLLLTTLNHAYKENTIAFKSMKLDLIKLLLEVLSKYISHFFINKRYDYSKLLALIATKAIKETAFKDNPEIIIRECAINNNISCIYESKEKYNKAYKYISINKKYIDSTSNLDKIILYNNIIRIAFKGNKINEIKGYINNLKWCLLNEIKKTKENNMKQVINDSIIDTNGISFEKNTLLSFLIYNLGLIYEKLNQMKEANEMFTKGFEFSMSSLGEYNFYTNKLMAKINKGSVKNFIEDKDLINIANKSISFYQNKNCTTSTDSENENIHNLKVINKSNSLEKNMSKSNVISEESFIEKLNTIYEYVVNKKQIKKNSIASEHKHSQSETEHSLIGVTQSNKKKPKAYEHFTKVLIPVMKKYINGIGQEESTQKKKTQDLINEVLLEFENEKQNISKTEKEKRKTLPAKESMIGREYTKSPRIKKLIEKVIDKTVIQNNKEQENKGMLTQIVEGLCNASKEEKKELKKKISEKSEKEDQNEILNLSNVSNISFPDNNNNFDLVLTPRNFLKPELENLTKEITVNISSEKEPNEYKFVPFYKYDNAYGRVVSKIINKQKVKQIKLHTNLEEITPLKLGKVLMGKDQSQKSNEENDKSNNDFINIEPPKTNRDYEFVPFFNKNPKFEKKKTEEKKTKQRRMDTKFMKGTFHPPEHVNGANDLLIGLGPMIKKTNSENSENEIEFKIDYTDKDNDIVLNMSQPSDDEKKNFDVNNVYDQFLQNINKPKVNISQLYDKIIEQIKGNAFETQKPILTTVPFQDCLYNITILKNSNHIIFNLYLNKDANNKPPLSTLSIDFQKLKGIVEKLYLYNSLSSFDDISKIETFDVFIKKIISYHLTIIKKQNKLSIGLSAKSNGVCGDKQITFKLLKTPCTINIICISTKIVRILISNAKSSNNSIYIDCYCDKSSFLDILIPIDNDYNNDFDVVKAYSFNEEHITKSGIVPLLMRKLQDVIKEKLQLNNENANFVNIYKDLEKTQFNCEITKNCSNVILYYFTQNEKNSYEIKI